MYSNNNSGIAYKNNRFLDYGLDLLKKIINTSFDNNYFPKSRNIRQMVFYLKYFILIRELLKDSLNDIPEYLNEIIFYLGKSYDFFWGSLKKVYYLMEIIILIIKTLINICLFLDISLKMINLIYLVIQF